LLARTRYVLGTRRALAAQERRLRRAAAEAATPGEIVAAACADCGPISLRPTQVESELKAFLSLVRQEQPERVLEIGTANGGTLYALAWASSPRARLLSIDIRQPSPERRRLYRRFVRRTQTVDVLVGDSQCGETLGRVERFFDANPVDVLLVDGDHAYESVRRDCDLYVPLVRSGGLVAIHDIVDGPDELVGGVPRFWQELRGSLEDVTELVESRAQRGFGIGVGRKR
jgi:predicted O-methyltransferase YrrM